MSSGINVAGAKRLTKELGPGHTLVTMIPQVATKEKCPTVNSSKSKGIAGTRMVDELLFQEAESVSPWRERPVCWGAKTAVEARIETRQTILILKKWSGDGYSECWAFLWKNYTPRIEIDG